MLDYETLIRFARTLEGQTLHTQGRAVAFTLCVPRRGLQFTPTSTGNSRKNHESVIRRVLARYNEQGSLQPGDYKDLTVNASYLLTVVALCVGVDPAQRT